MTTRSNRGEHAVAVASTAAEGRRTLETATRGSFLARPGSERAAGPAPSPLSADVKGARSDESAAPNPGSFSERSADLGEERSGGSFARPLQCGSLEGNEGSRSTWTDEGRTDALGRSTDRALAESTIDSCSSCGRVEPCIVIGGRLRCPACAFAPSTEGGAT